MPRSNLISTSGLLPVELSASGMAKAGVLRDGPEPDATCPEAQQ